MLALGSLAAVLTAQSAMAVEPIYGQPAGFNPQPGERIRIGSLLPPALDVQDLLDAGITFFNARTSEWGSPATQAGLKLLDSLAQRRAILKDMGAGLGVSVFTTFPEFDESLIVGEGMVNLLDSQRVPTFSPWDIERIRFSATGYGAVNRKLPKLDFVTLKILSEYGDASFFTGLAVLDKELAKIWEDVLRSPPPKAGFWAGDPKALASWQRRVNTIHGSNEQAYADWGMTPPDPQQLPIPITPDYPYAARLEWMTWYRETIPYLVAQLTSVAREIFLETPLLIPVGPPNDLPYLGLDIFAVARSAQKADGIKVTNLGFYDFAEDWAMSLGRIRGAARTANVAIWTEAPTVGTPRKFEQRIFESLSLGARGIIDWPQAYRESLPTLKRLIPNLDYSEPRCDVAVIYPSSSHVLRPTQPIPALLYRSAVELRDYLDFDVLDESAVIAGALVNYRVAVLLEGSVWDTRALNAIRQWVRDGGVIAAYDFGRMADPLGGTSVWSELFGWSTQVPRARPDERWQGAIPESYRIALGGDGDEEFLQGRWGAGGANGRIAHNGAQLRLPVKTETDLTVSIHFVPQSAERGKLDISVNNRKQAGLVLDGGIARFQLVVSQQDAASGVLRIGFEGMEGETGIRIAAIEVAQPNAQGNPVALEGFFESPVSPAIISSQWSRRFGRGLTVFMPGQRPLWKTYIALVRALTYRLSEILEGASNAMPIDDQRNGVYATDLGNKIVVYNSTATPVTQQLNTSEGKKEIRVGAGQIAVVPLSPPPQTVVVPIRAKVESPDGVSVSAQIPKQGLYKAFVRTLRDGRLVPVRVTIGRQDFAPTTANAPGDLYPIGTIQLETGEVRLTLASDRPFDAEVIVLTDDPTVIGYRLSR